MALGKCSWRKYKKEVKKNKRLYYRVTRQFKRPPKPIYYFEVAVGVLFELLRYARILICWLLAICMIAGIGGAGYLAYRLYPIYEDYNNTGAELISEVSKESFAISESSRIYDAQGNLLSILKEGSETSYLKYEEIPQNVINAFVAVEDRSFWSNDGVDYKGIVRVVIDAIRTKGAEMHGASTITQQLVRNNFLTREVSLERKAKEILAARMLTRVFTKREIIEFYVNDICYANGIYGIDGAAKAYFNREVSKLSLSQIAYLCAIPNSPTYYDPFVDPTRAIKRRDKILGDMLECGYINDYEYKKAIAEEIVIERASTVFNDYETTYATDCAIRYLMKLDGFEFKYTFETESDYNAYHTNYSQVYEDYRHKLYTGGYQIYTSLDEEACDALQEVVDEALAGNQEIDENTGIYTFQGAVTVINNETGNVVALVGGRSQESDTVIHSFNRAYQTHRQPGSSIKPLIVYTPALEHGYTPDSMLVNIDVEEAHEPEANVQELEGNQIDMRTAVWKSSNGTAWWLYDRLTPQVGMFKLEMMHYSDLHPSDYCDATALGGFTKGVSTVEQASAYAALANHGDWVEPTCIVSMIDATGKDIYKQSDTVNVYEPQAADTMVDILKGVLTNGTAAKLGWYRQSSIEAFCKTGTTNGAKDGWMCGSTPYYSIAVWIGYDTPKPVDDLSGSSYPGRIWRDCMLYMTKDLETAVFDTSRVVIDSYESSESGGYYSYMPGRDDNEVLSSGYTVGDYRKDRVIGESVQRIAKRMSELDMTDINAYEKLSQLKSQADQLISTIYSRKYTNEMQGLIDSAYNSKL